MRPWIVPFLAGATALALVATTVGLVVQTRRADAARERAAALEAEVAELRAEVERLERSDAAPDGLDGLLGGLLGDGEGLDGLLGGLLGDGEGAEGLLDGLLGGVGGGVPGAACLTPAGDLGDVFGGLFGGGDRLPDDPDELVEVLRDQVADLRELDWTGPTEVTFLDDAGVRDRLDELLADEADPAADDAAERLLTTLGAIPPGTDLPAVRRELLDEQVAGFYVPETGELVVRVPDDRSLGALDRITLAHELQHALGDQQLGLPDLEGIDDADAALAALAVVEGDATLLMNRWALEHVPLTDQLEAALGGDLGTAQASLERVPPYLRAELVFPYTAGLDWVCDRWLDGGWAAVDAAYAAPPTTTAEILHGEAARPVRTAPTLQAPTGFRTVADDTFGAAPLRWLLQAPGGAEDRALPDAHERTAAWAGGRSVVWTRGEDTAVGLAFVDGDGTLCDSLDAWYAAAFPSARRTAAEGAVTFAGDEQHAVLTCRDEAVRVGIGPDLPVATSIVAGGA